jgi:hypothetical protein
LLYCLICAKGPPSNEEVARSKKEGLTGMEVFGILMLLSGLAGLFFFLLYDTSVKTERVLLFGDWVGGDRVHNLSKASNREAGLIASGVVAVIGTLLMMVGKSSRKG